MNHDAQQSQAKAEPEAKAAKDEPAQETEGEDAGQAEATQEPDTPDDNTAAPGTAPPAQTAEAGAPAPAHQPSATSGKAWIVDYKEVWVPKVETVVDVPAHEEPVYGTRDVLVRNACGYRTESSGSMGSHLSDHAAKGVDEGYTSRSEKVQTGTVSVPAQTHEVDNGHYEKVEADGHWE